jgi:hypothetical protein
MASNFENKENMDLEELEAETMRMHRDVVEPFE